MLDGGISWYWWEHQDCIWSAIKSCKSSLWWTVALIQKLWDILWDMWDHCNKVLLSGGVLQNQITDSLVNLQITTVYEDRVQQLPQDTLQFLCQSLSTVLQYSLVSKQLWPDSVGAMQDWWQHHKSGHYLGKQWFMTEWLLTTNQSSTPHQAQPDWEECFHGSGYII